MLARRAPGADVELATQRAALAEAQLAAAEAELEAVNARLERIVTLLAETRRDREAAIDLLECRRRSLGWRLTEPLRAGKRAALRLRGR
jgi:hypothetical protein